MTPPHPWTATRQEGLNRLQAFLPKAGAAYASGRNFDLGPGRHEAVSCLSPYLRRRLVTEEETVRAVLSRHSPSSAEKFIQEVFWRSYFKGWLEHHPSVWSSYTRDRDSALDRAGADYLHAVQGRTGIDCFDHWTRELITTGYLHNHARMWFASIWIFTLRLPWQLGADVFLRHLLDGDPASNTCSWRWVGGLHTRGKTYLAHADSIRRFTGGAFDPKGLARHAAPLQEAEAHPLIPPAAPDPEPGPQEEFVLLRTEDDLLADQPEWTRRAETETYLEAGTTGGTEAVSPALLAFSSEAARSVSGTYVKHCELADWAGRRTICAAYVPVGPVRDVLDQAGVPVRRILRSWDSRTWPHASRGFFDLKKKIPELLPQAPRLPGL